jgi:hypothetical protein
MRLSTTDLAENRFILPRFSTEISIEVLSQNFTLFEVRIVLDVFTGIGLAHGWIRCSARCFEQVMSG